MEVAAPIAEEAEVDQEGDLQEGEASAETEGVTTTLKETTKTPLGGGDATTGTATTRRDGWTWPGSLWRGRST